MYACHMLLLLNYCHFAIKKLIYVKQNIIHFFGWLLIKSNIFKLNFTNKNSSKKSLTYHIIVRKILVPKRVSKPRVNFILKTAFVQVNLRCMFLQTIRQRQWGIKVHFLVYSTILLLKVNGTFYAFDVIDP